jgi:hypothetical protein
VGHHRKRLDKHNNTNIQISPFLWRNREQLAERSHLLTTYLTKGTSANGRSRFSGFSPGRFRLHFRPGVKVRSPERKRSVSWFRYPDAQGNNAHVVQSVLSLARKGALTAAYCHSAPTQTKSASKQLNNSR